MLIRTTRQSDLPEVLEIHRQAFGQGAEANLVKDILADKTAQPTLSLLAEEGGRSLGHILFSALHLSARDDATRAALLAPLAVVPQDQGKGIGSRLVEDGLAELRRTGVELVFVLGDPAFYGRFGFEPAIPRELAAPFMLPDAYLEAWRVKVLSGDFGDCPHGQVICCDALNKPELWQE